MENFIFFIFGILALLLALFIQPLLKLWKKFYGLIGIKIEFSLGAKNLIRVLLLILGVFGFFMGFYLS